MDSPLTSAFQAFVTWAASPAPICSTRNGPVIAPFMSASAWLVSGVLQIWVFSSGHSVCMAGLLGVTSFFQPAGMSAGASRCAANPVALAVADGAGALLDEAVAPGRAAPAAPGDVVAAEEEQPPAASPTRAAEPSATMRRLTLKTRMQSPRDQVADGTQVSGHGVFTTSIRTEPLQSGLPRKARRAGLRCAMRAVLRCHGSPIDHIGELMPH